MDSSDLEPCLIHGFFVLRESDPERHLDWFSRFAVVAQLTHMANTHTDTQTHTHTSVATDRIFLMHCVQTMRPNNNLITGLPNGPVLFCWLSSVVVCRLSSVVLCNAAGVRAGQPPGAWERGVGTMPAVGTTGRRARGRSVGRHCTAGQSCYVQLGRQLVIHISILP